ncbi:MAG TPA: hypothetical protein VFT72_11635 [Opitutaceae bacterium]|nr:hypothetical protein [Opitutaceae bacterium]
MSSARRVTFVSVAAISVAAWGIANETIPAVFTPTSKNAAAALSEMNDAPAPVATIAQNDRRGADGLNIVPTQMEAVRVHDSRLEGRRLEALGNLLRIKPPPPSLENGALLLRKNLGGVQVEVGPQPWSDLLSEDAKFSQKPGLPRIEFIHFRF